MNQDQLDKYLCWASYYGHLEVVRCLLENGANVYVGEGEPIKHAAFGGNVAVVRLFIKHGANVHIFHDFEKDHIYMLGYTEIYDLIRGNYEF